MTRTPDPISIEQLWNEPLPPELCRDEAHYLSFANQDRRAGLGLSITHNGPPTPHILARRGSSSLHIETGRRQPPPFDGRHGLRGTVDHYSVQSAARHRHLLAKIRRDALPVLVCLTYPLDFPRNRKVFKRHLKVFHQRLRRKFPQVGGTWKLEFQAREAPHFHEQLWGVPFDSWVTEEIRKQITPETADHFIGQFRAWVSQTWYEVVGSGDEKHFRAGTTVERARSFAGAMCYVSSYSAKPEQTLAGQEVGRYWGVVARENIPFGEPVERITAQEQAFCVARTARRLTQSRAKAAHLKRMRDAKEGKWKGRHGHRRLVKPPLRRKVHGKHGRKVNRLPRIRAAGCFKAIVDADFWLSRLPKLMHQRPLPRLPRLIGFRPTLP